MKKNFIYTLCLLLSGAFFMSSCEDMLEIDTTRVDNEFNDLTLNDSVYSVLGIVKSLQTVADRQVLFGELRGDLVVTNPGKAVIDVQGISNFEFDLNNPYLAVKDYYAIINNCNVFLSRVDTTIERSNQKLMLKEFVAVKSLRAWTYLQLAINYGSVPYFTDPILTHQGAIDVMQQPMKSRDEIVSLLIEDLTPYENPRLYPMPVWTGIKVGNVNMHTANMFMPIRALLGELHLWRGNVGDYKIAAEYFYQSLTNTPQYNNTSISRIIRDNGYQVSYKDDKFTEINSGGFSGQFEPNSLTNTGNALFGVPMESSTSVGLMSGLNDIFAPEVQGAAQVSAAPGFVSLSDRQIYCYYDPTKPAEEPKYTTGGELFKGDLRRFTVTGSQRNKDTEIQYDNIIGKFNNGSGNNVNGVNMLAAKNVTDHVTFYRFEMLYARFAEALLGMAAVEGIKDADLLAMVALGGTIENPASNVSIYDGGLSQEYVIKYNHVPADTTVVVDAEGNPVLNAAGSDSIVITPASYSTVEYDFSDMVQETATATFENTGLHSRGSGYTPRDIYYSLRTHNIAEYYDLIVEENDTTYAISRPLERQDTVNYITDRLIDELALEFCFEGNRFGDLIRFAKFAQKRGVENWQDVLAKRVAGRAMTNAENMYNAAYEYDNSLYNLLQSEQNWYLPLPGSAKVETPEAE